MALKTKEPPVEVPATPVGTTILELALYKIYTWGNESYHQGHPYRFRNEDAMRLLAENDLGRPIWKIYRPPPPRVTPKNEVIDATGVQATLPSDEPIFGNPVAEKKKRIDVGTDEEIQDILNRPESDEGNITV